MASFAIRFCVSGLLVFAGACSSRASDEDSESSSGDGPVSDAELRERCAEGCERFKTCAAESYNAAYSDDQACEDFCFDSFSVSDACREASVPYSDCTLALECSEWPGLLSDPATSNCSQEWAAVDPPCGLSS